MSDAAARLHGTEPNADVGVSVDGKTREKVSRQHIGQWQPFLLTMRFQMQLFFPNHAKAAQV